NCAALKSCCDMYVGQAADSCYQSLYSATSNLNTVTQESQCSSYKTTYCPAMTGNCMALKSCCDGFPSDDAKSQCYQKLFSANGNDASCLSAQAAACPNTPNCTALKTCCASYGTQGQQSCYSQLLSINTLNPEPTCGTYNTRYCPTGPNCSRLKTCC